jgi:hypothetical protein
VANGYALVFLDLQLLHDAATGFVGFVAQVFSMEACSDDGSRISAGTEVRVIEERLCSTVTDLLHMEHQAEVFGKATVLKLSDKNCIVSLMA